MTDPATERPLFATRCIELCCEACKEAGKVAECVHLLHLVPSWQSEERHRKLKIMMCVQREREGKRETILCWFLLGWAFTFLTSACIFQRVHCNAPLRLPSLSNP